LMEKQKSGRHAATRTFKSGRAYRRNRPIFRRRRRRGFFAFCALVVLLLSGLGAASFFGEPPSGASGGTVQRVEAPAVAEAPEPVADLEAKKEAEREGTGKEKAAKEQRAKEKAAEEKEATPPAPEDPTLYLTVPRLGIYGHTVRNDDSQWALDAGAIKVPETGFPWQEGATNTYIAGHRIGWPGTESYYQFFDLPAMREGDVVYLADANGTVYTYQVSEIFAVSPWETWVTKPIPGGDVVSLQTCTETPTDWWTVGPRLFEGGPDSGRLVVRADRVS
jgi:sortase A